MKRVEEECKAKITAMKPEYRELHEKDRDFNIKVKATHELKEFFINALSLYPDMTLATDHGCFSVVLKDCKLNKDTFQIKLISK